MRSSCSVYVDAGYLLASTATRATGTSLRKGIHVNYAELLRTLIEQVECSSGLPLLRVHWYDSAHNAVPDREQERIGELPRVKLRLGRFGFDGQQKGVDLRIGLDMVSHARNRASDVYFLVSGDDDLTEAVEEAQLHGVQVIVLAVPNIDGRPHAVSRHLLREADGIELLSPEALDATVVPITAPALIPSPPVPPALQPDVPKVPFDVEQDIPLVEPEVITAQPAPRPVVPTPLDLAAMIRPSVEPPAAVIAYTSVTKSDQFASQVHADESLDVDVHEVDIDVVVNKVIDSLRKSAQPGMFTELLRSKPSIPREIDRALLLDLSTRLNTQDLSDPVRFRLRGRFWDLLEL